MHIIPPVRCLDPGTGYAPAPTVMTGRSMAERIGVGQSGCVVELHDIQRLLGCFEEDRVLLAVFGVGEVVNIGGGLLLGMVQSST